MEVKGRKPSSTQTCDSCAKTSSSTDGSLADGYCTECNMYLCGDCCRVHRNLPPCKNHKMLAGKRMPKEKIAPVNICESHQGEPILYFCKTHTALACQKCTFPIHKSCNDVQEISTLANDPKVDQSYKLLTKKIKTLDAKIDKNRQTMIHNVSKIDSNKKQAKADIKNICKVMHDYLFSIEQSVEEEVDQISQEDNKHMNKIKQECDSVRADLLRVVTIVREFKQNTSQREQMFIAIEKVTRTVEALDDQLTAVDKDNFVKDYKFDPDNHLKAVMTDMKKVGRLVINAYSRPQHTQAPFGETTLKTLSCTLESVTADTYDFIEVKTYRDRDTCWITGLTLLEGDTTLAVVDRDDGTMGSDSVKLVDVRQKKVISQIRLSGGPWDITQVQQDQLAVTLPDQRKVQFLQVIMATTLSRGREVNVSGECRGLAYDNDRLFVSFTDPVHVQIMSMRGKIMNTIGLQTDGQIQFKQPLYLTLSVDKSLLYVSDAGTHTVYCLDTDGKLKSTFQDQELKGPWAICTCGDGSVAVCGYWSHNLYVISDNCTRSRVLLNQSRGVESPYCVAYSGGLKTIYLSQFATNTLKVFKLK